MDTRSGQLYETEQAAKAAGVPARHLVRVDHTIDEHHCQECARPVKVRKSTPTKQGSDGRLYRWCKRCWFKRRTRIVS